ncbi:MAG: hypothetical protein DDT42_01345 [candidate division WS2 bacterium]|uniref:Terminase small subunit n=1 Tax=Psychracetigena formicireducens TaxID=2986056 RepID=A0A9E2BI44_PSYF1|nr:hypothetical protein [Candidatus Psychracetigena formicireducens]MBT9145474.1 hypothetical protein [Candidatus Psychracetigena formicireducens]
MEETLRHQSAFDYYYSLGEERNIPKVAQKYCVSTAAVFKWSKAHNWQLRIQQRDIENARELEKRTNKEVVDAKADFRKTIQVLHQILKKSINEYIQRNQPAVVYDIKDLEKVSNILDKIVRVDMGLVGEGMEGEVEKVVKIEVVSDKAKKLTEEIIKGAD